MTDTKPETCWHPGCNRRFALPKDKHRHQRCSGHRDDPATRAASQTGPQPGIPGADVWGQGNLDAMVVDATGEQQLGQGLYTRAAPAAWSVKHGP